MSTQPTKAAIIHLEITGKRLITVDELSQNYFNARIEKLSAWIASASIKIDELTAKKFEIQDPEKLEKLNANLEKAKSLHLKHRVNFAALIAANLHPLMVYCKNELSDFALIIGSIYLDATEDQKKQIKAYIRSNGLVDNLIAFGLDSGVVEFM